MGLGYISIDMAIQYSIHLRFVIYVQWNLWTRLVWEVKFFSRSYVWQIVSSLSLWILWKGRCSKLYNDENAHVVDQVKSFWELLVHTVKGDYDNSKGSGNTTNQKRRRIRRVWSSIPIMLDAGADVRWNYVPPRWLFPPPAPFLEHTT